MLRLIASVDQRWGIGLGQELLFHIPEDMRWFKEHTIGSTVVLGRKTLESFPGGKPLKDRRHLVLSHSLETECESVIICDCVEKVLEMMKPDEDMWVIGGEQVYRQMLPFCEEALITKVDSQRPADRFLPNLDEAPDWELVWQSQRQESGGIGYRFCRYVRKNEEKRNPF